MGSAIRSLRKAVKAHRGEKELRPSGARHTIIARGNPKTIRSAVRRNRYDRDGERMGMVRSGHYTRIGYRLFEGRSPRLPKIRELTPSGFAVEPGD
jgi:hypothetical protein